MNRNLLSYAGFCLLLSFMLLQSACKKADLGTCEACRDGLRDKNLLEERSGPAFDGQNPLINNYWCLTNYVCTPNGDGNNDGIAPFVFLGLDSAAFAVYSGHPIDVTTQIFYGKKLVHENKQIATSGTGPGALQYADFSKLGIDGINQPEGVYKWIRSYYFFDGSHLKLTGYTCSMKGECIDGSLECRKKLYFWNGFYQDPGDPSGFNYDPALAGETSCN